MAPLRPTLLLYFLVSCLSARVALRASSSQDPEVPRPERKFLAEGCWSMSSSGASDDNRMSSPLSMTTDKCFAFCDARPDAKYFGVQNGGECWCSALPHGAPSADKECSTPCGGNKKQSCGDKAGHANVFVMFECEKGLKTGLGYAASDAESAATATTTTTTTAIPAVTLINPSFETGATDTAPSSTYEYDTTLQGWTLAGEVVSIASENPSWGTTAAAHGKYYVGLQNTGATITQTVKGLEVGAEYKVKFYAATRNQHYQSTLSVTIDGQKEGFDNLQPKFGAMAEHTFTFAAAATSCSLIFKNIGSPNNAGGEDETAFIDAVQMMPVQGSVSTTPVAPGSSKHHHVDLRSEKQWEKIYAKLAGQSCGQGEENDYEIDGSSTLAGSVEDCQQKCYHESKMQCHGFTYDPIASNCHFVADVLDGKVDDSASLDCYYKKIG